jgi:DNA polymerase (family X)
MAILERLRGASDPIALLRSVPGIGTTLADRLHYDLGIDTLEALETAAHDGRLEHILGFGPKRLAGIRDSLAHRLSRVRAPASSPPDGPPPVDEILSVDREYREKAAAGRLTTIAPRRFNPSGAAWLPILHTERGVRQYTALFSNTARAHELGKTHDWVVISCDGRGGSHQYTVITAERGALTGRRIVRGREDQTRDRGIERRHA